MNAVGVPDIELSDLACIAPEERFVVSLSRDELGRAIELAQAAGDSPLSDGDWTTRVDDSGRSASISARVGTVADGLPGEHATNPLGRAPGRVHGREGSNHCPSSR